MSDDETSETGEKSSDPLDQTVRGDLDSSSISPNSIEGVFLFALQKDSPAERDAYLDDMCGDDQEKRNRVIALLRAYDDAGSFMETPAAGPRKDQEVSLSFLKPSDDPSCLGTIGPYRVLEVIGRGGMGLVLRAVDPKLNRVVAVKVLLPELAANPTSRRRFLREAQAAAAVSHPHVVTIHAVEETKEHEDGTATPPYLVMECVVGQSLQQKLDAVGPLRLPEILRISRQIGEGLVAAHRQGLIHRDIKPGNILLENGVERVKITDFGLARAKDDITVTRTGEVTGTPQYMSPEQAGAESVDHRSDLFSQGCVMYAMCTGHSPFRGDSLPHVIKRVTQDTPRSIAEQNAEAPPWLIQIIDCLLQKKAEDRFQSAEGLVAILDQHLARIQQPSQLDSGHSVINQQVPQTPAPQPAAKAAAGVAQTNMIQVPNWLRSIGRIYIAVALIVLFAVLFLPNAGFGIGRSEFLIVAVVGMWPALMGAFLCRRQMTRESLLVVLFLGMGPLGLVIYLYLSERLKPADDFQSPAATAKATAEIAEQQQVRTGTRLMAFGALIIFCVAAWFLLIAFNILDASATARQYADEILCFSMLGATLFIAAGMLLRGEILGHRSWKSFLTLGGFSLLGPLGLYYWMDRWQKNIDLPATDPPPLAQAADSTAKPSASRSRKLWLLPLITIAAVPVCLGAARWLGVFVTPYQPVGQIVLHHRDDLEAITYYVDDQPPMSTNDGPVTVLSGIFPGTRNVKIELRDPSDSVHVLNQKVVVKRGKAGEIDLRLPVKLNEGDKLGPADSSYGGLFVEISDQDLHVMLVGLGPDFLGYVPKVIPTGRHQVPVGRYNVMVFDKRAGWLDDVKSRPNGKYEGIFDTMDRSFGALNEQYRFYDRSTGAWSASVYTAEPSLIEIKPGQIENVVVCRDLKKLVKSPRAQKYSPSEELFAGDKFHRFLWNGQEYSLTSNQAQVINRLLHHRAESEGQVGELKLLENMHNEEGQPADDVKAIFNDGTHPAWDEVIVEAAMEGEATFDLK